MLVRVEFTHAAWTLTARFHPEERPGAIRWLSRPDRDLIVLRALSERTVAGSEWRHTDALLLVPSDGGSTCRRSVMTDTEERALETGPG